MTSQLNVDTIVDKAGTSGSVHLMLRVGNTSTYVSDGGSATQNTVQRCGKIMGLCKFRCFKCFLRSSFNQ